MSDRAAVKSAAVVGAFLMAMVLVACGEGNSSSTPLETRASTSAKGSTSKSPPPQFAMAKEKIEKLPELRLRRRRGPPPKKLVIRDLREGFGATMQPGDEILVGYIGRNYGRPLVTTPATRNPPEKFAFSGMIKGWQLGLPGMKVGGRREIIVPKRLGYPDATIAYIIDLLAVYPVGR